MTITLGGSGLTIEKLVQIARFNERVQIAKQSEEKIIRCRQMLYSHRMHKPRTKYHLNYY